MVAFTTGQAAQTAQHLPTQWDEAVSRLTPAIQSEWATLKGYYMEELRDSMIRMTKAQAAYQMAVLEERKKQAAAREDLNAWLAAHGVDRKQVAPALADLDPAETPFAADR